MGYDPCQSRPPYFGTYNGSDTRDAADILKLARFPLGASMPRVSSLDYDYDSGDDWDVVEGDEDVGASSGSRDEDEENEDGSSLSESDMDFINDEDDGDGDADGDDAELQRKMLEARQRRVNRLRQKDKLVPAFSGPFVGVALLDHPLREYDQLERFGDALSGEALEAMLQREINMHSAACSAHGHNSNGNNDGTRCSSVINHTNNNKNNNLNNNGGLNEAELQKEQQQRLIEFALRNRREMTPAELDAVHVLITANAKISRSVIIETLLNQQLCVGVARAEVIRTIQRHYDHRHGIFVRRAEPWTATDERLFSKPQSKKKTQTKLSPLQPARAATADNGEKGEKEGEEEEEEAEREDDEEKEDQSSQQQKESTRSRQRRRQQMLLKALAITGDCVPPAAESSVGDATSTQGNTISAGHNEDDEQDIPIFELFRKRARDVNLTCGEVAMDTKK